MCDARRRKGTSIELNTEGDPGRGGLQGTRPRAGQLGGPASRGLSCLYCSVSVFPGWRVGPRLACSPTSSLGAWGWAFSFSILAKAVPRCRYARGDLDIVGCSDLLSITR
eukprot:1182992-Prorocentrum_minimum.AAC.1